MSEYLHPSEFACRAAGVAPVSSIQAPHPTSCILCGAPIAQGGNCTHANDTLYTKSFMDQPSAAARGSSHVCEHCVPLWTPDYLQKYSKSLVTREGFFKLASNIDQASFLLNPPQNQPFMAFVSNAKQQHLIWRTPVNYSGDRYTIRLGTNLVVIRHAILMRAVDAQNRLLPAYIQHEFVTKKRKVSPSTVFLNGDREFKCLGFVLNPIVVALGSTVEELKEDLLAIQVLSAGERWALSIIGNSRINTPSPLTRSLPVAA